MRRWQGGGMRWIPKLAAALLALSLQACAAGSAPPQSAVRAEVREPVTILISFDAFRPDFVSAEHTPNLWAAQREGISAAMRPSFPTMTFPNHYTLVTGLRPDRHGIVDNKMRDPMKPGVTFDTRDVKVSSDPFWWDGAEPIWVAAQNAGMHTGEMYWPGSHVDIRGVRADNWWPYDEKIDSRRRTETVLDWLRRPAETRPRLIAAYYSAVDRAGHDKGFSSPELHAAIAELDAQIGAIRTELARLREPANLVIVSDHGMAPIPSDQEVRAETVLDPELMDSIVAGPMLYIFPKPGREAEAEARMLAPRAHAQCWRKQDIPARFHYGANPRVAPIVCMSETGWRFTEWQAKPFVQGDHGFDNDDPSMRALFIGVGPAFKRGVTLPVFDNVDVYPLLRDLLGLPTATGIDGSDAVFAPGLR